MCGIAGIIFFNGVQIDPQCVKKMTDTMVHRGPDGEGVYVDGNVGLGHRRLSIIDLSRKAAQPMESVDRSLVITYNGEIYNFKSLRKELQEKGYVFQSESDTEVVLYAYDSWGAACVEKFNGMFAFAIWDKKSGEIFIARDRYGIKPLYYCMDRNFLIFASEQRGILASGLTTRDDFDQEALLEYFTFQNIFTDKTFRKNIKMFPAGSFAVLSVYDPAFHINRYWDYDFRESNDYQRKEEYVEELDRLFQQAIHRQLVSDVDLGSYLSGGIDSGSISAIASREIPYMKTFTCGFDLHSASGLELSYDEREAAEYMSYLFKTEHYEMVLKAGDMERAIPTVVSHLEEPRVGQSYPNYYAAKLASKFVKVVLSGAGGDELFAGYPWRYYRAVVNEDFDHYIDKYFDFWQRLLSYEELKQAFRPIWKDVCHVDVKSIFRHIFPDWANESRNSPTDYINLSLYFEAKTFLHGLLIVEDKLSMANGLETRVPLLDNDLVDFAMRIPVSLKLKNLGEVIRLDENETGAKAQKYFQKTNDGKLILRKVMNKYIPQEVTKAVKQGFSAPDASWFRGESIEYVRRLLGKSARIYQYMDYLTVQKLLNEHMEGKRNRRLLIWSLINFEMILQKER